MKILIVVPTYFPAYEFGGPIFQIHNLSKLLKLNNIDITVCTTDKGNRNKIKSNIKEDIEGVEVFYFSCEFAKYYFSIRMIFFLFKNIKKYDLIHIHSIFNFPTSISLLLSSFYKKKIILSPRGILDKKLIESKNKLLKHLWLLFFNKILSKKIQKFHATTDFEKNQIRHYFEKSEIEVIANGIDINYFDTEYNKTKENEKFNKYFNKKINLLYLGRIDRKKNIDLIFKSIKKANLTNFNLNIVGNGDNEYLNYLIQLSKELNLFHSINFINHMDGGDKINFYIKSSHLLLPSKSENFANVVLESIFFGKSVLISENVGLKEFIKKHNFGVICETDKTFENELSELIYNKNITNDTYNYGRKKVIEHYDWDKVINNFISMYMRLI